MSGSESFASFTNRYLYLSRPPGLRRAFDVAERMEDLAAFSAIEVKRAAAAAEEREKDEYSSAEGQ